MLGSIPSSGQTAIAPSVRILRSPVLKTWRIAMLNSFIASASSLLTDFCLVEGETFVAGTAFSLRFATDKLLAETFRTLKLTFCSHKIC